MKKILIVEDDAPSRETLKVILSKDYEVETASNGLEAGEKILDFPPDLILMDIMMPEMDGYKAIKLLKAGEKTRGKAMKVIVITALTSEAIKKELEERYDIKHFYKPLDMRVLKKAIAEEIGNA